MEQRQASKVFSQGLIDLPTGQQINVHKAFNELIKTDVYGSNLAQRYVNLIIQKGSSSGNKVEAYKMYMSLKKELAKQLDKDPNAIKEEMTIGDYEHLLEVFEREFGNVVTLYR